MADATGLEASSRTSRARAVGYAVSVMVVAAAIAELKNALAGH